jgi:hypothetical protein
MLETYDQLFNLFNSSSRGLVAAEKQIRRLKKYRAIISRATRRSVRKTVNLSSNASKYVRHRICPICGIKKPENCEGLRDNNRRYYCRYLSETDWLYVRLYLPSPRNSRAHMEDLKNRVMAEITSNPEISQNQVARKIGGDKRKIIQALKDLEAIGILDKIEGIEKGRKVFRFMERSKKKPRRS